MNRRFPAYVASAMGMFPMSLSAQPLGTAFTHHGDLGTPANGAHDLRFRLFIAEVGGTQVGPLLCADNVDVTSGAFVAELDFGAAFAGQSRFLEIEMRADTGLDCSNGTGFTAVVPRVELLAIPNAIYAISAGTATNASQFNGQSASFYQNAANITSGTLPSARLGGTYTGAISLSNATNVLVGSGAGITSLNATNIGSGTLSAARLPVPLLLTAVSPTYIIRAQNNSTIFGTTAIHGISASALGTCYGVMGESASQGGRGVFGRTTTSTGVTYGVLGQSMSNAGRGMFGSVPSTTGTTYGGYFESFSTSGTGVYGRVSAASGAARAVSGETLSASGYAGYFVGGRNYFSGNVGIGTLSPTARLHIAGTAGVDGIRFPDGTLQTSAATNSGNAWTASGGNISYTAGNVGIGTASPLYRVHVVGTDPGFVAIATSSAGSAGSPIVGIKGQVSNATAGVAVLGLNDRTSGVNIGVRGSSASPDGTGVSGTSTATTGSATGVSGTTQSESGRGVYGQSGATSGVSVGVSGQAASPTGFGVRGVSTANTGSATGISGDTSSTSGIAVSGFSRATTGATVGVRGEVFSPNGNAVVGLCTTASGTTSRGVYGQSSSSDGTGVFGMATHGSGVNAGVIGRTSSTTNGWGVYSEGNLGGSGLKAFSIDHPLDPANKYLNHFSAEGPEAILIYRGNAILDAQGEAWIDLPDYFEAINRDFQYQLTAVGAPAPMLHVAIEIEGNRFKVGGGSPGLKVSWTVTGIRNDPFARAYPKAVEETKPPTQVGTFIHPELYGMPPTSATHGAPAMTEGSN